ncbi:MAG: PAS domain S-box protein [Burkholderiaceae bacterium]|jgi:two-component system sensor histidine kinase DctS|nr:PAS domain S-box protein [Burkholderiaceae bacterium]
MLASSLAMAHDEPASASERRARWSAIVIVAALVVLLGTTLWLAFRYEQTEKQESLSVDVRAAASTIRSRLRETEQALLLSASELRREDGETRFRQAARELVIHNPALLRIERRRADGTLVDAVDAPAPRPRVDEAHRIRIPLPTQLALSAAGGGERLAYSRPHYLQITEGTGFEVIELAASEPVDGGDVLFAVYSLPRVLDVFLPAELIAGNQVMFTEADGTLIARATHGAKGRGTYVAGAPLELGGTTLTLRADSMQGPPKLIPNLLAAMLVAVTGALALSVGLLWRDVRLRTRTEQALRAQHAFRKAMEDSLITGLRARDNEGRITYVNPAFCEMTGFSMEELIGHSPPMPFWRPETADAYAQRESEIHMLSAARLGYETSFRHKDGHVFPVLIFETPLIDVSGRKAGWMGSILDLSEQKRAEELNRRQQEKLQETARMASLGEVATTLSHELNQPLAAITSYATACENLLERSDLTALRGALTRIHDQAERAGQVIKSVNDFMRRRKLERQPVEIRELILSLEPLIRLQARKHNVRIAWRSTGDTRVMGDRTMLEQVLLNLTRNAIQSMADTPQRDRSLEITATRLDDSDPPSVEVSVLDRGHGVPVEARPMLFQAFFTTKSSGLGIGLSLCRTVIEQHAGRLEFEPRPGGGSRFGFTLPALTENDA